MGNGRLRVRRVRRYRRARYPSPSRAARARRDVPLRERVWRATDYPYRVVEFVDGRIDDSDRTRAEELLRSNVRALLDDLRRDGML